MARPEYIARLHAAKYDLRDCSGSEKAVRRADYLAVLKEASEALKVAPYLIEAAVVEDYRVWLKQEKLPKLSPPSLPPAEK